MCIVICLWNWLVFSRVYRIVGRCKDNILMVKTLIQFLVNDTFALHRLGEIVFLIFYHLYTLSRCLIPHLDNVTHAWCNYFVTREKELGKRMPSPSSLTFSTPYYSTAIGFVVSHVRVCVCNINCFCFPNFTWYRNVLD